MTALEQAAAAARGQRQEGRGPPRDHPHPLRARPRPHGPGRAEGLRPGGQALPRGLPPRRRSSSAPAWRPRWPNTCSARAGAGWWRPAGRPSTARRSRSRPAEDDSGGDQLLPKLDQGEARGDALGRVAAQGDPAAAALHRRLAARGDGDRRQGGGGRRAARGHEGLGHRHAGHPRGDHRAAGRRWDTSSARAARWWPPRRASR